MKRIATFALLLVTALPSFSAGMVGPLPYRVPAALPDQAELLSPSAIHVHGWLGERITANATNRLLMVDIEPLLAGFRKKPGVHPWIGEHIGKWMHAATLAWVYTGDPRLRAKLDHAAAELVAAQEPDGYLGTYVPEKRFGIYEGADWDVWSHKYNLIGLLTYYQYTGNEAALGACQRMGDLLIKTFGAGPDQKSILSAGTHVGMAATSVLEPIVILYRFTGDQRYLDFAKYIVQSYDEAKGPKIIAALLDTKQVNRTANGKAYEMLSNLVGLCELARVTGDRGLVEAVMIAWNDIVGKRLYITGSASQGEHFQADYELPNQTGAHVAETCVTTTWIQLNLQLLRLTGEAKYGDELEKTLYNHLAAAQRPRGDDWCYFTALEGVRPYDAGINCCHSSGPRGMSLGPQQTYLKGKEGIFDTLLVSTFESSAVELDLGGTHVIVEQHSRFPYAGESELHMDLKQPAIFGVKVRVPPWAGALGLKLNGKKIQAQVKDGWAVVPARMWGIRDSLSLKFDLAAGRVPGTHGNKGLEALVWGPFVLAYDAALNREMPPASLLKFADRQTPRMLGTRTPNLEFTAAVVSSRFPGKGEAVFTTFADAGSQGMPYRVWLADSKTQLQSNESLLAGGVESQSRAGNVRGSITDADAESFVVTFNKQKSDEDWFAVTLNQPARISRVVFVSGNTFHDGGWFDASAGKPRIQVLREKGGEWKTVAEIAEYPATTATDSAGLSERGNRTFSVKLPEPMNVIAVRVVGKPACGDNPQQAFSSCAELQGF